MTDLQGVAKNNQSIIVSKQIPGKRDNSFITSFTNNMVPNRPVGVVVRDTDNEAGGLGFDSRAG